MLGFWQACSSRLVGRSAEVEHLCGLVEPLRGGGSGGLVLVSGEAGVGKSRLVREVSASAEGAGLQVLTGRAVPAGEPYRPLVEALSTALRDRPMPDDDGLRPYLPVLAAVLPDAEAPGQRTDPRGGVVLGEAVLRLVAALAGGAGTLLVLEDLHWADPDTLTVLTYLAHAAESAPLLLVVTSREEDGLPQPLMELVATCQATVLPLVRLDPHDVREMVEACLSGRPSDEVVAFAVDNADGLPLLVEELLTGLGSVGALTPAGRLVGPLTPGVPRTFAATVRRRVDDLEPAARTVVQAAAVLGRRFDWSLLPDVTGLSRTEVLAGLRAAVRSGLVVVDGGDAFRFRHALTGEAIRDDLLPPERLALAHAAAEIVERRDPEGFALAAGLRAAAGEEERAAELSVAAGRQAARRGALHSADVLLGRAAELAGNRVKLRAEAERALLDVLAAKGDAERALELGERLLAGGDQGVRLVLAQVAAGAERWDVAAAYLSAVPGGDDPQVGVLTARLAHARGRPEQAREMAEAALATAKEREQWSVACQALEVVGRAARIDDAGTAREAFAAAERLAADHDLPLDRVSALHELGTVDLLVDGSTSRLERARSLAVDAGVLGLAATLDVQVAAGLLHRDVDRALTYAVRSAELARRLRIDRLWATAVYFQAIVHVHRRETEEVERCVQQALALAPDDLDVNAGIWGEVRAHEALLTDDRDRLAYCLDQAIDYLRRSPSTTPAPVRGLWALVRTLDDRDGAAAREEARPSSNWEVAALLGYADAVDDGRRGRRRDADRLFAAADTALADLPWWRHRVRLLVADAALADGWGDPIGWTREALPVFAARGDSRLASCCRELLRRAGAPVPRPGRGDTPVPPALRAIGVTSREVDVLQLMADGLTNSGIAQKLVLSPRTVETHVANLVAKTGVANRAGLVELARAVPAAEPPLPKAKSGNLGS